MSESRTPWASLNSVSSFPPSPTGMGEDRAGREVGKGSTHRGVMLWFGLLAGMSWQSEASAPPNTYADPEPYSGRSAPSQGIPNWSLKAGGSKSVLEWALFPPTLPVSNSELKRRQAPFL